MKIAVIGGGAAGFFAAIHVAANFPEAGVTILEKSNKVLSKVKVSGGGRCNVCNSCTDIDELSKNYPRGSRQLRKVFGFFSTRDTMNWFENRGVELVIQEDNCVFPKSQNSQTIIDCFWQEALDLGVQVKTNSQVNAIEPLDGGGFSLLLASGDQFMCDRLIVTTGGQPKSAGLDWLRKLGHAIEEPVPSLFTFNMPSEPVKDLMGIVVERALVTIPATKLKSEGPLLITHWGMSGPAILKLSAFGARLLAEKNYDFRVLVNWLAIPVEQDVRDLLEVHLKKSGARFLSNSRLPEIPQRLWDFLLKKSGLDESKSCDQLGQKDKNKLVNTLTNDEYRVQGKTTFKEEFVTCGGVSLQDVSFPSMQSKKIPGMYFAGEILDIDGITGGFNFQAAWSTAYMAAQLRND